MEELTGMNRDIAIRTSGLLQAIINSGAPPEEWEERLNKALIIHQKVGTKTSKILNGGK